MLQFYFLSVAVNLLAGAALSSEYLGEKIPAFASLKDLFSNAKSRVFFGFAAVVVGVFKLFLRAPGDAVPVAGDLLPFFTGLALGLALLTDFFKQRISSQTEAIEKVEKITMTYKTPIGLAGILAAALHFLFPTALIL